MLRSTLRLRRNKRTHWTPAIHNKIKIVTSLDIV